MLGNKQQIIDYVNKGTDEDMFECTKKQKKSVRSIQQNKYYWSIIVQSISDWSGDSVISVHYMIKQMFQLETTTDLDTSEFKWMVDAIRDLFQTKYGLIIPTPEDKNLLEYIDNNL